VLDSLVEKLRDAPVGEYGAPTTTVAPPSVPVPVPATEPATLADGVEMIEGEAVSIMFDGNRCIHARFCVTQAPATFLANVDGPWIKPDATDAELLCGVVRQCPSGALTYRRRDGHDETAPPVNLWALRENGPYAVKADLSIDGEKAGFRATLCRCGASKNKPFCDKSHIDVNFVATGEPASRDTPLLVQRDGPLAVAPEMNGPLHVRGNLEIVSGTGRTVARVKSAKLCRCGGSGNKPFCDQTHRRIGFRSN
jgi:CDGSH-type Zn-finger protein/uncharacterized Fe-S cluster protein YjdI